MSCSSIIPDMGQTYRTIMEMKVDIHKVIQSDCKTQEVRSTIPMRVRMSPACSSSVSSEHREPSRFERRLDEFGIHTIEINLVALAVLLHTERHRDKRMGFHTAFCSIDQLDLAMSRRRGCLVICLFFSLEHLRDVGLDLFSAQLFNPRRKGRVRLNMGLVGVGSTQL